MKVFLYLLSITMVSGFVLLIGRAIQDNYCGISQIGIWFLFWMSAHFWSHMKDEVFE